MEGVLFIHSSVSWPFLSHTWFIYSVFIRLRMWPLVFPESAGSQRMRQMICKARHYIPSLIGDASFLCRCWWWINHRVTFVTVSSLTGGGREVKEKKAFEQLFIDFMGNLVGYQIFWQVYWMFADIRLKVNRDMSPSPWNITSYT